MKFDYQAYMLRLCPYKKNGKLKWSASLQVPGGEEKHNFSSVDKLFTFILAQTGHTQSVINLIDREAEITKIEINIHIQQHSSGDEDET